MDKYDVTVRAIRPLFYFYNDRLDEDNQFSEVGSYKDDPESILINEEQEAGSLLPASIVYFPLRKQYKQPNTEIAA